MEISQDDKQDSSRQVALAAKAVDQENYTEAIGLAADALEKEFDNPLALYVAGMALYRTKRHGLAYTLFKRCAQIDSARPEPWNMMGVCAEQTWQLDLAERHFKESLKRNPKGHEAMENLSLVELNRCNPEESLKWAARAEASGSKTHENNENRAMALLMKRDWSGWKYYKDSSGGTKQRTIRNYCGEPMWDGQSGLVAVYGNQGLGDEIAFASCIPDIAKKASLIIDCDERLEGLFKRSFPYAKVYGTRFKETRDWDHLVDYSVPVDSLPYFFRQQDKDFPGTPYLVADPERRLQWRALFDSYKKPVIGISWSGGTTLTGSGKRSLGLENWIPIFKSIDAVWVSLEYKDRRQQIAEFKEETGIEIKNFERAVNVLNYDETAAMVSELDLVISVTTAVVHLSGALGKECWCIAPNRPRWFYGLEGDLPWYRSVRMLRQAKDGRWPIEELITKLRLRHGDLDIRGIADGLRKLAG